MPATVVDDARRADRARGRDNDLTVEAVSGLLQGPCLYCGETGLRMTLDRIDNSIGHTLANVVPACERCNYARRDMPYEAWLVVADAMRVARERGLFGIWTGSVHKRADLPALTSNHRQRSPHGTIGGYIKCKPRCVKCKKAMRDWKRLKRANRKTNRSGSEPGC